MRAKRVRVESSAAWMEVSDVTSRASLSTFGLSGREERVEGLRAVATTREVVCSIRYSQRAYPIPEEHPVTNQTASSGRVYGAIEGKVIVSNGQFHRQLLGVRTTLLTDS